VTAAAAGVDLALVIVVLGVAPLLGWADPPGTLVFLQAPWVLAAGFAMYAAEAIMERHPASFSIWHVFQRWVRLMGLVLLASMGTAGLPPALRWTVGAGMVAVGLGTYVASSGWQAMVILRGLPRRAQFLAAVGVDVTFAALLVLALDRPVQAIVGLAAVALLAAPRLPVAWRGHRAMVEAGRSWIRTLLAPGDWVPAEELPEQVGRAMAGRDDAPGTPPRGTRALLLNRGLEAGWVLAGSGRAWFTSPGIGMVPLNRRQDSLESRDPLHARLPVTAGSQDGELLVRRDGPPRLELEREIPPSA
jgi:hypothetical protein